MKVQRVQTRLVRKNSPQLNTAQFSNLEQFPFPITMQASMLIPPLFANGDFSPHPFQNVSKIWNWLLVVWETPLNYIPLMVSCTFSTVLRDEIQIPSFCSHNMSTWRSLDRFPFPSTKHTRTQFPAFWRLAQIRLEMLQFQIWLPVGKGKIILFFCTLIHRPCLYLWMFCSRASCYQRLSEKLVFPAQ